MKYEIGGQIMIDTVVYPDGSDSGKNLGGPAVFGYAGVRLWTEDVRLNINVGEDFYGYFDKWLTAYGADRREIHVMNLHGNRHIITYRADGSYHEDSVYGWDNMHRMDPKIENFAHVAADGIKGVYLNNNRDCLTFWQEMKKIRECTGVKTMWEIPTGDIVPEYKKELLDLMECTDYVSINVNEGKTLWETDDEQTVVRACTELPVEMVFLRAGEKGSYVIVGPTVVFVPSMTRGEVVDPTGCGNCSTATAMYAFTETGDPLMTGIMANISASYNLCQLGPYPGYTQQDFVQARELRDRLYAEYKS